MTDKTSINKYLKKRLQIIEIIEAIQTPYETDECYHISNPDFWKSRDAAELILAKMGINKPEHIKKIERPGYAIHQI